MKATVEVTSTIEIECPDEVVAEVLSEDWQKSFYTFTSEREALAWMAWVCERFDGPEHVDGLAGLEVQTRELGLEYDTTEIHPS